MSTQNRRLKLWPLVTVAILGSAASCDQATIRCFTSSQPYAATFELIDGDAGSPCGQLLGEVISISTYYPVTGENKPDLDHPWVAIGSTRIAEKIDRARLSGVGDDDPEHPRYAIGNFATPEPDSSNFCTVPSPAAATQHLPYSPSIPPEKEGGEETPEQPETHITYAWNNVRIFMTPAYNGTQIAAELTVTENECTAKYRVVAVAPYHSCADATGEPSEDLCAPDPDPSKQIAIGSGISPDYPVMCHPILKYCVLKTPPPALK